MNIPINRQSNNQNPLRLWYQKPAVRWQEALPLGNGRIGAMMYGEPRTDTIELSEITCFSGEASSENNQKGAAEAFYKAREAYLKKDYESGRNLLEGFIGKRLNYGTNLPVGNLRIRNEKLSEERNAEYKDDPFQGYMRSLTLDHALAEVSYTMEKTQYHRTAFVSNPHQVLVMCFTCTGKEKLHLTFLLDGGENPHRVEMDANQDLLLYGNAYEPMHSDGRTGVAYHCRLRIITNGKLCGSADRNGLQLSDADAALLLLAVDTDFSGYDPAGRCRELIEDASGLTYEDLLEAHSSDFSFLFDRVGLTLGKELDNTVPTDVLLEQVKNGYANQAFSALLFQYGRYLLISSSRENSPLPAHLQGVWNDSVASRIGWTCDMHLDINTQMNYWPAEVANLTECHLPLFNWIENILVPSGRITAKDAYRLNGWVAELVSNAWGFTAPYWHVNLSPCPTGGVWAATHLWEHYLFTGDADFLKNRAYPILREAVEFFTDYIFEDPDTGALISGPSISPENSFIANGQPHTASLGPTYETVMIRELFTEYIAACSVLKQKSGGLDRTGEHLLERVVSAVNRLQPFMAGHDGELKEWMHDFEAQDHQHRHTSHLLSLFPFSQITPERTPELVNAAKKTIVQRLEPPENWEDTGWARSMLMLYSARMYDGDAVYSHIQSMQKLLTNLNLLVKHPPTRGAPSFSDVYELDGNTGLTSCIAEALLQSHNGEIHLLPALPKQWDSGGVKGLCARGGFEVSIKWNNGVLTEAAVYSRQNTTCTVRYGNKSLTFAADAKTAYTLNGLLNIISAIPSFHFDLQVK
jgi:alpha-L-fucosidase 2